MLKTMLEELLETMKESKQAEVQMADYIKSPILAGIVIESLAPVCGTPACIIGEQALKHIRDGVAEDTSDTVAQYAGMLDCRGINLCAKVLGSPNLWWSVVGAEAYFRRGTALASGLFTEEEVEELKHLQADNPKVEDVILFLELCIEKVSNV